MANQDKELITRVQNAISSFIETIEKNDKKDEFPLYYPVDKDVLSFLKKINAKLRNEDDNGFIFTFVDEIKEFWIENIKKSIMCLRYYDLREPFKKSSEKTPVAYGIDELKTYFSKYTEFESMLYGSNKYYRDHVIHTFRTWLLGLDVLLKNNREYLSKIHVGGEEELQELEKISIWSIIALTHDLGYPLEKAQGIIAQTKEMMQSFVANPTLNMDITYSGIQNNINSFIVKFISSKMIKRNGMCNWHLTNPQGSNGVNDTFYVARLQPKYYMKLSKSLEKSKHGIVSSIIIYKLLQYFLESDYSIDEDYVFNKEEARQFYIRREILRAIASHTCKDIYHLDMLTFSYLLILVDDVQDWGRKRFSEFFTDSTMEYELKNIKNKFQENDYNTRVEEKLSIKKTNEEQLKYTLVNLYKQNLNYKEIFRDGQDTENRNFTFTKECTIEYPEDASSVTIIVTFNVNKSRNAEFIIKIKNTGINAVDSKFSKKWITDKLKLEVELDKIEDEFKVFTIRV